MNLSLSGGEVGLFNTTKDVPTPVFTTEEKGAFDQSIFHDAKIKREIAIHAAK